MNPDRGSERAQKAYEIYRGMKTDPRTMPEWNDLPRSTRGLLEWTARYVMLDSIGDRAAETTGERGET